MHSQAVLSSALVIVLACGTAGAAEISGKLAKVDLDKKIIVVNTNSGQELTLKVNDKTKVHISKPVERAGQQYMDKLEDLKNWVGRGLNITTDDKDKELAAKINVNSGRKVLMPE